jgi:hypothetical protein
MGTLKNIILSLLIMAGLSARAADITAGTIFTPGQQNITHVTLNAIVGGATINTAFYTAKSAGTPAAADVLLFYSTGLTDFRKATFQTALYNNTGLITTQTEDASPEPGDFVLTYDVSAAGYKKVTLQNLLANGTTNAIANFPTITTPTLAEFVPLSQSSTNVKVAASNLLYLFTWTPPFTNLPTYSAPNSLTNSDMLLIWDSVHGSNKQISVLGLTTNRPAVTAPALTAVIPIVNQGSNINQVTVSNLSRVMVQRFVNASTFGVGAGATNSHGFTTGLHFPSVLVCTVQCVGAENGYAVGDNLNSSAVQWTPGNTNTITFGYNATSVWYQCPTNSISNFPKIVKQGYGEMRTMTPGNWNVVLEAIYFP